MQKNKKKVYFEEKKPYSTRYADIIDIIVIRFDDISINIQPVSSRVRCRYGFMPRNIIQ